MPTEELVRKQSNCKTPSLSIDNNTIILNNELEWFTNVLDVSIKLYFCQECQYNHIYEITPPLLENNNSYYSQFILKHKLTFDERIILILALIPHIRPFLLDIFFTKNTNFDCCYTEFGGWKGEMHKGFLPTGETAVFILAGTDLAKRFEIQNIFSNDHFFSVEQILELKYTNRNEPVLSGLLSISDEYLNSFTTNKNYKLHSIFPALQVTTEMEWDDLVLSHEAFEEIENIKTWINHNAYILNKLGLKKVLKPGYRSLFYGPPGTGKTLTATLLGKTCGLEVYKIDLSQIVSKYIGETEKNLSKVFDRALQKKWILFFDEADALFGKRTSTSNSNDRHANQEIAYLLQKIEDFPGIIILASNLKSNIDEAFSRRFQSSIYFPIPNSNQRYRLWKNIFSGQIKLSNDVDLKYISEKYKIAGGAIINILRNSILQQLKQESDVINNKILTEAISKELRKEGKSL